MQVKIDHLEKLKQDILYKEMLLYKEVRVEFFKYLNFLHKLSKSSEDEKLKFEVDSGDFSTLMVNKKSFSKIPAVDKELYSVYSEYFKDNANNVNAAIPEFTDNGSFVILVSRDGVGFDFEDPNLIKEYKKANGLEKVIPIKLVK